VLLAVCPSADIIQEFLVLYLFLVEILLISSNHIDMPRQSYKVILTYSLTFETYPANLTEHVGSRGNVSDL
jgi:hypothetical protein